MDAKLLLDPKMTWIELICLALMLLLAVCILGPPKARRFALALLQRCVQGIGLAALLACAVFLVWPAAVPSWLNSQLSPVAEYLVRVLGESFRSVVWLVLAAAVTLIAGKTIDQLKEYQETRDLLARRGLPATQETEELTIELCAPGRTLAVIDFHEAVGQVWEHTGSSSPAEQQERLGQHLEGVAQADVVWLVLSVPAAGCSRRALCRFEDRLLVTGSWMREAIRLRQAHRTCAIAIVPTKVDSLFESEQDARRGWSDNDVVTAFGPLVSMLAESDKVEWAVVNPVSAFGFRRAELLDSPVDPATQRADEGEPEWVLSRDADLEPWNVMPLITWSFLAGMLVQEVTPEEAAHVAGVCRMLQADLEALDGWQIPVKGGF
jgi:hypothetical protein